MTILVEPKKVAVMNASFKANGTWVAEALLLQAYCDLSHDGSASGV